MKLNQLIEKESIARVHLLGKVSQEELIALYTLAEIFVATAPKEDFGLTPAEALSCGTPVVAWNDGAGPSEIVLDQKNGLLARPYDIKDMAENVKEILNNKFKIKKHKEIISSAQRFSEKIIGKQLLDEVRRVLQ